MTFNELLSKLELNALHVKEQKDLNGKPTGFRDHWDADSRTRVVLTPEAYAAASDPKVNNFVCLTSNPLSADKKIEDKATGKITVVPGSLYTNHFVMLGEPTVTLGKL